jgi:hypothetical protein
MIGAPLIPPRFDNGIIAIRLGELFGIDPRKIKDFHAESSGDPGQALVTIEAWVRIPLDQFNAILREAQQ